MSEIHLEKEVEPSLVPPLDPSLFRPSKAELEFLHQVISADDEEMRERVMEVQRV